VSPPLATPSWLLTSEPGLCPCGCIGRRRTGSFAGKTINGGANLMRQALFAGDVAARRGMLQGIEPRVKVLTMLGLLVTATFARHIPTVLALYAVTLVLAAFSAVPLWFFVKRVWLFIPVFTGLVVLPATFSFVTRGRIVVPFGTWFGHRVGMTAQGLTAAAMIVSRVAVSISLVMLLTLTTPWNRLLGALRALRIPVIFVAVLAMAYRYIFHLLNTVTEMFVARTARTVGLDGDTSSGRRFVAASAGALFGKANGLSEEIHMAMISRGYTGAIRSLAPQTIRQREWWWALACAGLAVAVLVLDRSLGR
jgi:cobalt/nickel transport system permease protein